MSIINTGKEIYSASGDIDKTLLAIEKFRKSQSVRLLDVYFIGPIMLYYAYKGKLSKLERGVLGVLGVSTVVYNYRNWKMNHQDESLANHAQEYLKTLIPSNIQSVTKSKEVFVDEVDYEG